MNSLTNPSLVIRASLTWRDKGMSGVGTRTNWFPILAGTSQRAHIHVMDSPGHLTAMSARLSTVSSPLKFTLFDSIST